MKKASDPHLPSLTLHTKLLANKPKSINQNLLANKNRISLPKELFTRCNIIKNNEETERFNSNQLHTMYLEETIKYLQKNILKCITCWIL